jgi:hypothetical protein
VLAHADRRAAVQKVVDAQAAHFNMSGLDLGFCYQSGAVISDGLPPVPEDPVSCYIPSTTPGARLPHTLLARDGQTISTLDLVPYDALLVLSHFGCDLSDLAARCGASGLPVRIVEMGEGANVAPLDDRFTDLFPEDQLLIVRPDGHIGARLSSDATAEAVHGCLARLLSQSN